MTCKNIIILAIEVLFVFQSGVLCASDLDARLEKNAARANEAFSKCDSYLTAWSRTMDPGTGLIPQNVLRPAEEKLWTPENSAADNFPFMVLSAWFTRTPGQAQRLFEQAMVGEKLFSIQRNSLPSGYDLMTGKRQERKLDRLIFGASEYAKDGLVPMLEILGPGPWSRRMEELVEGIFAMAPVETRYGALPSNDTEVNGEMLQILTRLYWMTGREKYLEWSRRIGDAYLYEILPYHQGLPAHFWDFQKHTGDGRFKARDHGCE
ncbi:MAG: hypothetical protein U9P14_10560, partial [Gemmatimonadota bacterium]|nr:hypothetical protein [Gemmatimonadota bacterium]